MSTAKLTSPLSVARFTHADIEDEPQTVYTPSFGTTAYDKADGTKELSPEDNVTLEDKITYTCLTPNVTYTAYGTVIDKSTGKALVVDGHEVTASTEFTPTEKDGEVFVTFNFSAKELGGKTLVVYEQFMTNNTIVGRHEDINSEAQTVTVRETVKPPKTSDSFPFIPVAAGAALLVGASVFFTVRRRRYNQRVVEVMNRTNR